MRSFRNSACNFSGLTRPRWGGLLRSWIRPILVDATASVRSVQDAAGLALFYAACCAKNVLSVLMQCFAITCLVTLAWVVAGYSIAFGDGGTLNAWYGGWDKGFLSGIAVATVKGSIPETVFAMFQLTFAIITPALVIGAYAERVKFSGMLLFSLLWLLLVYCPIAHWVWGDGWLQKWASWISPASRWFTERRRVRRGLRTGARPPQGFPIRRCRRTTCP